LISSFVAPRAASIVPADDGKEAVMAVFFSASALFVIAFVVHLIWWRLKVPRRQSLTLLALFLTIATGGFAMIYVTDLFAGELPVPRLLLAILLLGSFCIVYLILFSALEADSPTLTLIRLIADAGLPGIHGDELMRAMERHSYVQIRIDQMIADGMAVETPTGLRLASQGLWLSSIVLLYRRMLARRHVGG
jgi:predicted permease